MNMLTLSMVTLNPKDFQKKQIQDAFLDVFNISDEHIFEEIESYVNWKTLKGGDYLLHQGDDSESIFIVLGGKLRVIRIQEDGTQKHIAEITKGESIGEMGLFTEEKRSASIQAIRDCDLLEIPKANYAIISEKFPQVSEKITRILINRLNNSLKEKKIENKTSNIAIIANHSDIKINDFCEQLMESLPKNISKIWLTNEKVNQLFQKENVAQTSKTDLFHGRLTAWLNEVENQHEFTFYQADLKATQWTRRCIRQADKIVIVTDRNHPELGKIENELLTGENPLSDVKQELVILHPNENKDPENTAEFLDNRPNVKRHHHIRWNKKGDFERLGRFLSHQAVGLVLGGGGARGFAHIGIIKVLEEQGIPIDFVGGTSIGSVVSGAYAMWMNAEKVTKKARVAFVDDKPLKAKTLPMVSLLRDKRLNRVMKRNFGLKNIEDQWLNFFCISSNLTTNEMVVHQRGQFWKAIRASLAIPGILPPVVYGNDLLIDGGMVNNLPMDVMKEMGVNKIIAVDLSISKRFELNYEEIPSPWKLLRYKFFPPKEKLKVPSLISTLIKSTLIASYQKSKQDRQFADVYLSPPVSKFSLLDMNQYDKLVKVGYEYGKENSNLINGIMR